MPDPQRDISAIIEPPPPPLPPPPPDYTLPAVLALGGLIVLAVLVWFWRRRAPLRALRRIAKATDPVAGANALAILIASQRVTPPAFWEEELELLRFGPPAEDAQAMLTQLCQGADSMLRNKPGLS